MFVVYFIVEECLLRRLNVVLEKQTEIFLNVQETFVVLRDLR